MLFDLQSPGRRRFIKVIYASLAVLLGGGLIFFGIGSDASGGLSELFTGNSNDAASGFDDDIDDANERLEQNPQDTAALAELVQLHYQAGTSLIELDEETGRQRVTAEAEEELQKGADAWDRYLKIQGENADPAVALLAVQNFSTLADGALTKAAGESGTQALADADDSTANWQAAADAQRVAAEKQGDASGFANLATFLFFAADYEAATEATQRALAAAKGDSEKQQIQQQLDQIEKQARQINTQIEDYRKAIEKAAAGGADAGSADSPLGGGGGLGGAPGGGLSTP